MKKLSWWRVLCGAAAAALLFALGFKGLAERSARLRGAAAPELRISSGTFSSSLDAVLKAEGFEDAARYKVSSALSKKLDLRRLRPGDRYTVAYSTWGPVKYLQVTSKRQNYLLFPSTAAGYSISVLPVEITTAAAKASGLIKSSLWESMSAAGVPPALILDYTDIFSWSVDFLTEVRDGDKWALAWDYGSDPSGKMITQKITAAYYDGQGTGRKAAAASGDGYYDEDGESVRSMFLRAPLHYRRISSFFTYHRFHPVLKYVRPHLGIDYAAPTGTPISAVADGKVTYAGMKGGFGRFVSVKHALGYVTTYGHMSRWAKGIKTGRRVSQGDVLGYVGMSGIATGPHLDFRVMLNGKPLNFLKMKYRSSGGVSGRVKAAVAAAIKALPAQ